MNDHQRASSVQWPNMWYIPTADVVHLEVVPPTAQTRFAVDHLLATLWFASALRTATTILLAI